MDFSNFVTETLRKESHLKHNVLVEVEKFLWRKLENRASFRYSCSLVAVQAGFHQLSIWMVWSRFKNINGFPERKILKIELISAVH